MSRGKFLIGTVGGIAGTIAGITGIIWSVTYAQLLAGLEFYNYLFDYTLIILWEFKLAADWFSLLLFSLILATLLIVSGVLTGAGFYGVYTLEGGGRGLMGFIAGTIGSIMGVSFVFLGNILPTSQVRYDMVNYPITNWLPWGEPINSVTYMHFIKPTVTPNFVFIWFGMAILAITFILLGSTSKSTREITVNPSISSAAGTLSILGGLLFFACVPFTIAGWIIFIGFILISIAFVLWSVVFYSSRES
ncbi:MAG: hypothetical protein ACETWM_09730 [Candidatus Lokiarchaeia archaeon]